MPMTDIGIIMRDVAKGLASIVTPARKMKGQSEYLILHYCQKCQKYHVAGTEPDGFPSRPRREGKPEEYMGMHYCQKCDRYHKMA